MPRIASACPRRTTSTTAGEPSAMSTVYPSDSASALTAASVQAPHSAHDRPRASYEPLHSLT